MAITIASQVQGVSVDGKRVVKATVTLDNSYPTGGYAVTPAALGLRQVEAIHLRSDVQTAAGAGGNTLIADVSNVAAPKLKLYSAASTELANATDVSARVLPLTFLGH